MIAKKNISAASIIGKTVAREKWLSIGIVLTVTGAVVVSLLPPFVLGKIIDRIAGGNFSGFSMAAEYFLLILLTGALESLRESFLTVFGQKMTHAFRSELSNKLVRLSADTLNKEEPGAVVSRFVGDVDTVEALFTSGIISMFADACRVISIFVMIWFQNRGLALLLIVLIPVIFAFTRIVQKRMLTAQLENRATVSRVTNHVPETIRCIRTIHTLGKETYMEKRYDDYIGEIYSAIEKTNFYDAVYSPVILFLNAVAVAAVMLLAVSGNAKVLALFGMSVGTSVAVINYISQVFSPIENLGMEIQTIQSAVAGVYRINEFLEKPEREMVEERAAGCGTKNDMEVQDAHAGAMKCQDTKEKKTASETGLDACVMKKTGDSDKREALGMCGMADDLCKLKPSKAESCVEFKDVTFGYDDHIVLNDLNFAIYPGEQVTLTGRTGAGKSTIFKLLLGLYRPNSGEALIEGEAAYRISDREKRRKFGYVEQSFHMVPGTVRDQITLFDPEISDEAVQAAAKLVGLHETIMSLDHGYDTLCKPEIFSQGQWQLLSIVRAVAGEPRILLFDEITANLDAETEEMVLRALKSASEGCTVISISHRVYQKDGADQIRYLAIGGEESQEIPAGA